MKKEDSLHQCLKNLTAYFSADPLRYVVPRVTFVDGLGRKRLIDFALISRRQDTRNIAILLHADTSEQQLINQREMEVTISALQQQNWIPLQLTVEELTTQFETVAATLKQLIEGETCLIPPVPARASFNDTTCYRQVVKTYRKHTA